MNIIIKDVSIVTMNENDDIIKNGYIVINREKIKEVGYGEYNGDCKDYKIIDGKNSCVMPGLVNCHTHAAMTLLRGYGEGLPLMKWLNEKIWPMEAKFREEHISVGTKLAIIEMIRTGTTTFNDMYFFQKEVLEVAQEFNIRAVLGTPIIGDAWKEQLKSAVKLNDFVKEYSKNEDMIKTMIAPHAPYTLSKEALIRVAETAKQQYIGVHIHISETQDEVDIIKSKYDLTPTEFLLSTGILDNKVIGAHCVHMTDNDIKILRDKKVSVAYNPQSNMKLASGVARIAEMLDNGVNVCLGTDGTSSNNNLNMFEEMETGALLQKLWYKDTTKLNGSDMLNIGTVNGAKALGFEKLGRIEEGYKADLVMLDMNRPNMIPRYDIDSNIVFSASGNEVHTVIINGEIVLYNGEFLNIDEERILYESNKFCENLI